MRLDYCRTSNAGEFNTSEHGGVERVLGEELLVVARRKYRDFHSFGFWLLQERSLAAERPKKSKECLLSKV